MLERGAGPLIVDGNLFYGGSITLRGYGWNKSSPNYTQTGLSVTNNSVVNGGWDPNAAPAACIENPNGLAPVTWTGNQIIDTSGNVLSALAKPC